MAAGGAFFIKRSEETMANEISTIRVKDNFALAAEAAQESQIVGERLRFSKGNTSSAGATSAPLPRAPNCRRSTFRPRG